MSILFSSVSFLYGLVFIMWLESWLYISISIREWRIQYRTQINGMLQLLLALSISLLIFSLATGSQITLLYLSAFSFILGIAISHHFSLFWIGQE